jgi:hypothetical protein
MRNMAQYSVSLIPFPDPEIPDIQITGTMRRSKNLLTVSFLITGRTDVIYFPEATAEPHRRDDLWKTTCFEFFLAVPDKSEYWEFNMSPSGDWNAYRMDAYRQIGLKEETAIDLTPFIKEDQQIQAEITSVIEDKNGHETYWALTHPGIQADFHRREGFVLLLNSVS